MLLMIDNYDSFTYNIVQYLGELKAKVKVLRNDVVSLADIECMNPERIVISPGPSSPENAGISVEVIQHFAGKIPMLGVCLGHQAMAYAYGAKIVKAKTLMHGKVSKIRHNKKGVFKGLPNPFEATRYHSLAIDEKTLPSCFEITARAEDDGEIMGIQHKRLSLWGVQFHPESILTKSGMNLLENFLAL